jgi:hypothetical protein
MSADAFKTVIVSCREKQTTKMVYQTNPPGTIKIEALHPIDVTLNEEITDDFTIKRLKAVLLDFNKRGYETMSITNGSSRGGTTGLTLDSTIILSKKYSSIWED